MLNKTSAYCKGLMVVQFKHASKKVRTQREIAPSPCQTEQAPAKELNWVSQKI